MSFSFKNIGHYIAVAARDIAKFGIAAQKDEPLIEGVTALIYPPAVVLERASFSALGYLVDASQKAAPVADGTVSLTVQVAADEVADFKNFLSFFQAHAAASGVPVPPSK